MATIPLYVVAGQSNAVRIYSTGAFEDALDDRGAGELGLVSAENGQSLFPSQVYNDYYPFDDGDPNTGELYRDLVDAISAELAANSEVYLAGVFWLQGEEDATSTTHGPDYGTNITELYQNLTELFGSSFDFVISALSSYIDGADIRPAWDDVRTAQEALASSFEHVHLIDPDDMIDVDGFLEAQVFDDEYHYTHLGYDWLADQFFDLFPVGGNSAPDAFADAFITDEDTGLSGNVLADNGGGADSDREGDTLTVDTTPVVGVSHGSLVLGANGAFSYTPDADFSGTDSFVYAVSDGNGGTDMATVTIAVTALNDDPVASNDSGFSTPYATPLEIAAATLVANDDDGDPETTQSLTVTGVGGAVNGTVSLAGGTVTFTPTAGYFGPASFTYDISDGAGGTDSATVSLTVGENGGPVAAEDSYGVDEDTVVVGNVLDNDEDPEDDPLTAVLLSGPVHGVLSFSADGSFAYEADADLFDLATPGEVIEETFTYEVADDHGGVAQASVSLFVTILDDGGTFAAADNRPDPVTGTDGGEDLILGGRSDDRLDGRDGADTIKGAGGDDRLLGGESVDTLFGQAGDDNLLGEAGDDELRGGAGRDMLVGGAGDDRLYGGEGQDTLRGGAGDDRLDGGASADLLKGGSGADVLLGGAGDDVLRGEADDDVLSGKAGDDLMKGAKGSDLLKGGSGKDALYGDTGGDDLRGGSGRDMLYGGDDDDVLEGGKGSDLLEGGAGRDSFVFATGGGVDTVVDFTDGEDLLRVEGLSFGDLTIAQDGADATVSVGSTVIAVLVGVDAGLIGAFDFMS